MYIYIYIYINIILDKNDCFIFNNCYQLFTASIYNTLCVTDITVHRDSIHTYGRVIRCCDEYVIIFIYIYIYIFIYIYIYIYLPVWLSG